MLNKIHQFILKAPIKSLLVYGVLSRIFVHVFYGSVTLYPDSYGYIDLSKFLLNFSLNNYSGERTPGFPLFIALVGGNHELIVIAQNIIGLLSIVIFFDFCKIKTKNVIFSFWTTLITYSFLHILFFEFAVLTETLSLFLVLLTFWLIKKYQLFTTESKSKHLLALSLILGFLYFTRPMFIYLPIGFFIFYLLKNFKHSFLTNLKKASFIIIIPLICYYSWCSINKNNIGYFSSSYFLGINLSQTATPFFEKVPDEDKLIRDILVKHREQNPKYKSDKANPMSVWYAWPELLEQTQLSPPDLSNELKRISVSLFKDHPDLYIKQVLASWKDFWGTSLFFWRTENIKNKAVQKWMYRSWYSLQQYLVIIINILFIIFSILKIGRFLKNRLKIFDSDFLIITSIIAGSLAQALVVYGSNSRFCVPFFPLIVYFVLYNLYLIKTNSNFLKL